MTERDRDPAETADRSALSRPDPARWSQGLVGSLGDAIVATTGAAIFALDLDGGVTSWNPGAARLFGYEADEIVGRPQTMICSEAHHQIFQMLADAAVLGSSAEADVECRHKDGTRLEVLANVSALRDEGGALRGYGVVAHDISARKRVEQALRAAHDTFRRVVEQSPFGIYVVDADLRITYVSEGAEPAFENVRPLIGRDLAEAMRIVWPEPFASEALEQFRRTLATGEAYHGEPHTGPRKDTGVVEVYDWKIARVLLPDLRFGVVCHFYDLSERKRALEANAALATQLAKTADSTPGVICSFRLGADGRTASFPYAASRISDVYGFTPEEVRESAEPVFSRIHPDDWPAVLGAVAKSARDGSEWQAQFRYRHPIKGEVWIEGRSSPVAEPGGGVVWHGYIQDITDRRQIEAELARMNAELERRVEERTAALAEEMQQRAVALEALARSQRLEAVGRLAGGLAHDFNNALTAISANLELAEMRIEDPRALDALRRALDAVELSANLNRRLLTFAPRGKTFHDAAGINDRISSMTMLLERTLGDDVTFSSEFEPMLWPARHDPVELDSAILNLAINARDAMPDGGHIRVATSNVSLSEGPPYACCTQPIAGDYVRITLSDNGRGMSPATLARATEPFFTTKSGMRNTGLGLSGVRDFAEACGGAIAVESTEGRGTSVSIYLPRGSDVTETRPGKVAGREPTPLGDGELVLLVEDNLQVLQTTHEMLEGLGYAVHAAAGGVEAMAALDHTTFDLVFSDIKMPGGVTGYDIARRLIEERPKTRIVLTTGYNDETTPTGDLLQGVTVLRKPYTRSRLAAELRKVLEAPPPARHSSTTQ